MKKENPLKSLVTKFSKEKAPKEAPENDTTKIVPITKPSKKSKKSIDFDEKGTYERELEAAKSIKPNGYAPNDFLITFLRDVWKHQLHTLQGFQLFDGKKHRNIQESDVYRLKNVFAEINLYIKNDTLKRLIYGVNRLTTIYNPLESYFNEITKEFDEPTARTAFETFVKITYDRIDPEKTTFEHWRRVLRVWLAFSYAQIFDAERVNDIALVLVSKTQGTGKTMIANALAAAASKLGLVGKPDFSDDIAKTARALNQNWIVIDGELSRRRKADVSKFKDILSEKNVSFVEKYEKQQTTKQRNATFLATGNEPEYLTETSRRESIIGFKEDAPPDGYFTEFKEKLYKDGITDGIWAYAFYVWKYEKDAVSSERETLSLENTKRSKDYLAPNFEDELVSAYFGLPLENSKKCDLNRDILTKETPENAYINLKREEIVAFLAQFTPQNMQIKPDLVQKSLEKRGFVARQKDRYGEIVKTGYRLRILKTNRLIDVETNENSGF